MIVDSKNIPQFIDELNIEVDQIKKELQQTIKNVEYASEYSEGVKLGDLLVGSQSTQVIAPQITMTAGPESGQFFLELPVGTESGQIVRPEVQNDANAESLEPEALLTGQTVESYLNSNIVNDYIYISVTTTANGCIDINNAPSLHFEHGSSMPPVRGWIPVVINHTTRPNSLDVVTADGESWFIYSDTSQKTYIMFYKIAYRTS